MEKQTDSLSAKPYTKFQPIVMTGTVSRGVSRGSCLAMPKNELHGPDGLSKSMESLLTPRKGRGAQ